MNAETYELKICPTDGDVVMAAVYDADSRQLTSLAIDTGLDGKITKGAAHAVRCASLAVSGLEHHPDRVDELEAEVRRLKVLLELANAKTLLT